MSEKLLKFLLSELKTVRLVCQGTVGGQPCGAVTEVPLERLLTITRQGGDQCRICNTPFGIFPKPGTAQDGFGPLAQAIIDLLAAKDRVQVEFVIPDVN